MLKNTLKKTQSLAQKTLKELEDDTDFTLDNYYKERISFHMKMLNYYLKEQNNEIMAARTRFISGSVIGS
jgi:hypothetical protein